MDLGAVLTQNDDARREYVITYDSYSNHKAKSNFSSYVGETSAVVWAISYFRSYLKDQIFFW